LLTDFHITALIDNKCLNMIIPVLLELLVYL
jgi:hypothetical protein